MTRTKDELKQALLAQIDADKEEIMELGNWFWKNPESGYKEFKTGAKAVEVLRSLGLDVRDGLAITGARADVKCGSDGPTVAFLGEIDSLILPSHPECDKVTGAVHSCGHCSHVTNMLAIAMGLVRSGIAKELAGRVAFITTPAEECIEIDMRQDLIRQGKIKYLGGKQQLIAEGVFNDVDIAIMSHLQSGFNYNAPLHNGFIMKQVTFLGRAAHAGTSPASGINAMNAITLAQNAIALLRETFSFNNTIRVHGIVTSGGEVINIIPDRTTINYQLRADNLDTIEWLSKVFDRAMKGAAMAIGADVEITTLPGYLPIVNDDDMIAVCNRAVKQFGEDLTVSGTGFSYGSTDMGDVSQIMPAVHTAHPGASGTGHGSDYAIANPEKAYVEGAKYQAAMLVDLLADNAELGRKIAAHKKDHLTVEQYLETLEKFNKKTAWKSEKI